MFNNRFKYQNPWSESETCIAVWDGLCGFSSQMHCLSSFISHDPVTYLCTAWVKNHFGEWHVQSSKQILIFILPFKWVIKLIVQSLNFVISLWPWHVWDKHILLGDKLAYNLQVNVQDPLLEVRDVRRWSMSARLIN